MPLAHVVTAGVALAVALTSSACASRATPAASSPASSPASAALGFDASMRSTTPKAKVRFGCPDQKEFSLSIATVEGVGSQSSTADTVRVGDRWQVTVTVGDSDTSTHTSYDVRREGSGYCVDDVDSQ